MTAEEAAFIMMSGGSTYTNEPKTITENGIYIPDDGVRWDKVTVALPIAALNVTANGTYNAIDYSLQGFDPVNVNVPDRYDEGYNKAVEDMEKVKEIIDGECPPTDVPDGDNGTYTFPDGAVGVDENNINSIAMQFTEGGYITNIELKLMAEYHCYLDTDNWWKMGINLYDLHTKKLIDQDGGSIPAGWGYTPVIERLGINRDDHGASFYMNCGWVINGGYYSVYAARKTEANTTWYISKSAPVYTSNN